MEGREVNEKGVKFIKSTTIMKSLLVYDAPV